MKKQYTKFLFLLLGILQVYHLEAAVPAPTLNSPANGATNVNPRFTIAVNDMTGVTSFQYELNTDATFDPGNADKYTATVTPAFWYTGSVAGIMSDYFFTNAGKFGKTYYLRVKAFNSNTGEESEWSNIRTFSTITAPTMIAPANDISNVQPRFTIAVSPMDGITSYQYELNTDASFASDNADRYVGSVTPTFVYNGSVNGVDTKFFYSNAGKFGKTYYLRVRAFNTDGGTDPSAWSNVRTFSTIAAPTLIAPENDISNVQPRFTIAVSPMDGITSYQYELNTDASFASDNADKYVGSVTPTFVYNGSVNGVDTKFFYSNAGKFGKTYYLRVRAFNTDGGTDPSAWSNVRTFSTIAAPTLTAPANDLSNVNPRFTIAVSPMNGITSYQYELNTDFNFASDNVDKYVGSVTPAFVYNGSVDGLDSDYFFSNAGKFGKTYYLRVRAFNTDGGPDASAWSNATTFSIIATIPLVSPSQDATSQSTAGFNLSWTDINGESGYEIQLSTSNLFTAPLISTTQPGVTKSTGALTANTTYYWRVRGKVTINAVDYFSAWSERAFTTGATIATLPPVPVLVSPANNATGTSNSPTLTWEEVTDASYLYEYSTDPNFITDVQSASLPIGTTQLALASLPNKTKYHWRVRSIISNNGSPWSPPFNFTTIGIPVTVSISDNSYVYDGTAKAVTTTTDPVSISHTVSYTLDGSPISTPTNAGTYDVTVTITDPLYSLSGSGSGTLTIAKKVLSVTADAKSKNYGEQNPTLTYQYSGFIENETASVIDTPPTISTSATQFSNVGEYAITPENGSDNNYSFSFSNSTLTVTKANLIASADAKSKVYGDNNPSLTFQYDGLLGSDDAADIDTPPSISCLAEQFSDVGTYPITLTGGSDNNYQIQLENSTLNVTKATLNVVVDEKSKVYGQQNPTLTFQYNGFRGDDTVNDLNELPNVSTSALQFSNVGAYAINLSGGDDNNYSLNLTNNSLTISKANLTVSAAAKEKVYGQPNPSLTFEYTGLLGDDTGDDIDNAPTIESSAAQFSNVGSYPITLTGGSDNNYQLQLQNNTLSITKAPLNLSADNKSRVYGEANPPLTISYTGFLGTDDSSDIDTAPEISTSAVQNSDVSTYPINLTGGSDNNYELNLSNGTLTIEMADQEITFDALPVKNVLDQDFSINASTSSELPVSFQSSNPAVASINGNTISIHATGVTEISAIQNGTNNYNAAPTVVQLLVVKQDQTINFPAIPDKTIGDAPFVLEATSPSGESIIYTPSNSNVSINGSEVTINAAGSVTITANQSGNNLFFPAAPVANTFCIKPAKPVIELQSSFPLSVLSTNATTGIQWFKNGAPIEGATSQTLSTTESGMYSVNSTVENCTSAMSDNYDLIVTSLETAMNSKVKVFPTITEDKLTIQLQYESSTTKEFTIYNPMGSAFIQMSTKSQSTELSVKELSSGVYFLAMRDGSRTAVVRFIKK